MLKKYDFRNYNFFLVMVIWITVGMGIYFINAADDSFTSKQVLGLAVGSVAMIVVSLIDYNFICKIWWLFYGVNIILLLWVKIHGVNVNGATRWISIAGQTLQPSEFCKIFMIISVACFLEKHKEDLNTLKTLLKLAVLCAIPLILVLIEPDLSSTLDIFIIMFAVIFVAGLSIKLILIAAAVVIPLLSGFLLYVDKAKSVPFLQDYQVDRIKTFLNPSSSEEGSMQQDNSVMAIGSGMLNGKGFSSDTTLTASDANLVPEQQTDFIFSVVGEQFGFIGCMIVIAFLLIIMLQCLRVAKKAKDTSGMLIATGMACIICFQSFINIGVATKLLPNTGLPLPFISYGLSSLLSLMLGMGMVLNVSLQKRKF